MDSTPLDQNPVARLGEPVYFYHEPGDPCAATIGKVPYPDGGPVDLIVYCLGKEAQTRSTWARGHSVVVFKGLVPHVTEWLGSRHRPAHFWSRCLEDVTIG